MIDVQMENYERESVSRQIITTENNVTRERSIIDCTNTRRGCGEVIRRWWNRITPDRRTNRDDTDVNIRTDSFTSPFTPRDHTRGDVVFQSLDFRIRDGESRVLTSSWKWLISCSRGRRHLENITWQRTLKDRIESGGDLKRRILFPSDRSILKGTRSNYIWLQSFLTQERKKRKRGVNAEAALSLEKLFSSMSSSRGKDVTQETGV